MTSDLLLGAVAAAICSTGVWMGFSLCSFIRDARERKAAEAASDAINIAYQTGYNDAQRAEIARQKQRLSELGVLGAKARWKKDVPGKDVAENQPSVIPRTPTD